MRKKSQTIMNNKVFLLKTNVRKEEGVINYVLDLVGSAKLV